MSENAAASAAVSSVVEGLLAREDEEERREESLQNTATRLAEDLAQVISSRVTGMVGEEGRSGAAGPHYSFAGSAGGLLSSLQELLPTSQAQTVSSSTSTPPASLSSVLHTLHSTYTQQQQQDASTAPTFQFATPPPPFPTVPVSPLEAPAPLPDALGPLSPSPTDQQEEASAMTIGDQEVVISAPPEPPGTAEVPTEASASSESSAPAASTGAPGDNIAAPPPPAPEAAASSGPSRQPDFSAILGDLDIPEGVDPSFLAALPEDMRAEVIEEQRRLVRARQAPAPPPAAPTGQVNSYPLNLPILTQPIQVQEVNPEFLAALPPNIQEEVLAQQRLEQQRRSAAQVIFCHRWHKDNNRLLRWIPLPRWTLASSCRPCLPPSASPCSPTWRSRRSPPCLPSLPPRLRTCAGIMNSGTVVR